jgi:hypothetical protein
VVDANTMTMVGKYDVSSKGGGCAGLALDAKNGILFAACREKSNMIILSAADGHIITDLPTGVGSDGMVFNPATMEAFSSQGDGTITVVKENSPTDFAVEETVPTPARAKTITLDAKTGNLYLATFEYGPTPAAPMQGMAPMGGGMPMGGPGAGGPSQGGPGAQGAPRRPNPPTIPNSFQILVVGK